jgi:hypothetical protein
MQEKFEFLKARMGVETSETLFDMKPQPKQQCPSINKMQANIEDGIKEIEYYSNSLRNIEGAEGIGADIEQALSSNFSDIYSELEELRSEIVKIRLWGEGWKKLARSIINNEMKEEDIVHYFSSDCQIKYDEGLLTGKK